jgi:hypothetical protein
LTNLAGVLGIAAFQLLVSLNNETKSYDLVSSFLKKNTILADIDQILRFRLLDEGK